jgi:endonuclease/exonuclease/phosphatase family metal-dependent hydrolase
MRLSTPRQLAFVLLSSLFVVGCNCSDPEKPRKAATDPAGVVAKAIGKGHVAKDSPWASRAACEAELERRRATETRDSSPRMATWNVRYFPDGSEHGVEDQPTDLDWLACSIALLDVDVLAVQEFKADARARDAVQRLLRRLGELTSRRYRLELARCEPSDVQHPGLLYDERRVTAEHLRDLPELNPDEKCSNSASPGFAAYLSFQGGPDLHVIVVHAYAGNGRREHAKRGQFLKALESSVGELARVVPDPDLVVTGDFNTSGCRDCSPALDSAAEARTLAERVAAFAAPLRSVPSSGGCSFAGQEPALLDHFLVSASLQELPRDAKAVVSGFCGESECREVFPKAKAERALSDHCPVVLQLQNRDLD